MTQRIPLPDERIEVVGAASETVTPDGIVYRRLPARLAHQIPVETDAVSQSPSGVRLRFATDASMIGLECLPTMLRFDADDVWPATIDLVVDGERLDRATTTTGTVVSLSRVDRARFQVTAGESTTITLTTPSAGLRTVEVWLPHNGMGAFAAVVLPDGARIEPPAADDRLHWIHHGSSISHSMEADGPTGTWPAVAAAVAGVRHTNLGLAGQCHLDQFSARAIRDLDADRISVKLGINVVNADTMRRRAFTAALHGFLDTIRDGHPDTPLLLVSPIICPTAEDTPGPTITSEGESEVRARGRDWDRELGSLTLRQIREIEADAVEVRRQLGDRNLWYLSGLELFGPDDVDDLPDGLHPNAAGYRRIGERFAAVAFGPGGPLAL